MRDEEDSIRDLVVKTLSHLWFVPISEMESRGVDLSVVSSQIMEVIHTPSGQQWITEMLEKALKNGRKSSQKGKEGKVKEGKGKGRKGEKEKGRGKRRKKGRGGEEERKGGCWRGDVEREKSRSKFSLILFNSLPFPFSSLLFSSLLFSLPSSLFPLFFDSSLFCRSHCMRCAPESVPIW